MASNIISSISVFDERFKVPKTEARYSALKKYFSRGGVISAVKINKQWPKIIYPSPLRVDSQLKELLVLKENYSQKIKDWKKKLQQAKSYHSRHQMLKFSEPIYWKHVAKSLADSDYRDDSAKVKLPVHLVADPKWKPMIRMFVTDLEYRKNLVETVQTSIVYKDNKTVAKYADVLQNFRSEISESKINELQKKLDKIQLEINSLELIKKWAKE